MAINTIGITTLYNSLLAAMTAKYDTMWAANEIDAETYAQLVGQASSQLVQLSAELVQKQEALDKDVLLKQAQIDIAAEELILKQTEVVSAKASAEAELEKQWGYTVTRDIDDQLVLGDSTGTGKIDKEVEALDAQLVSMAKDNLIKDEQLVKVQEEIDLLKTQDLTAIYEKDFILPANLAHTTKQTDVAERGMAENEATGAAQRLILATEEQAKQYEVDFILPEQLVKVQEEIDLLQTQDLSALEQIKTIYADRVLKDKQAAKLGLDNAMKLAETERASNPNHIYTPRYEEV